MNYNIYNQINEKNKQKLMLIGNQSMFETAIFGVIKNENNNILSCFDYDYDLNYYVFEYDNNDLIKSCKQITFSDYDFDQKIYTYKYNYKENGIEIIIYDEGKETFTYVFDSYYNINKVVYKGGQDNYSTIYDKENDIIKITFEDKFKISEYLLEPNKIKKIHTRKPDNLKFITKYKYNNNQLINIYSKTGCEKYYNILNIKYNRDEIDKIVSNVDDSIELYRFDYDDDLIVKIINGDMEELTTYILHDYESFKNLKIDIEHINLN